MSQLFSGPKVHSKDSAAIQAADKCRCKLKYGAAKSRAFQQEPLRQFKAQKLMNLDRKVTFPLDVVRYHSFHLAPS